MSSTSSVALSNNDNVISTECPTCTKEAVELFNQEYNPDSQNTSFDIVVDDAAGTLFTVTGENGEEIAVETDENNNLLINGTNYGEVDDDQLSFSIVNGELQVMKDGKELEGYTPIALQENTGANFKFDDITQNAQSGSISLNDPIYGSSIFYDNSTPRENDGGLGSTGIVSDATETDPVPDVTQTGPVPEVAFNGSSMKFSDYLSQSLNGEVGGIEQQKFQYGGYDSSDVTTLRSWEDILATGVVEENADGSVTLTSSENVPRVQFYPEDDLEGGRESTKVSELQDVKFDFAVGDYQEGEAAWIYELHNIGDGQAFAFGFNQEGNLLVSNGDNDDRIESDISFVDAGGVEVNYEGNMAHLTVLNKDGTVRGSESIGINATEVHVKGIEVYNRRAAADTSVSVTFNNITFGSSNSV